MLRKILIVDDNAINRAMLKNTLIRDYDVLEAEDGQEALAIVGRQYKVLSAILTDIVMPVVDGYELLRKIRENIVFAQIPVIMVTASEDEESRVKALMLGANDFILKPCNPDIMLHCVKNNIALRETASILNAIQKDKLTGLYNREAFFEKVASSIRNSAPGDYILSCFDIDNFKLINDQYGAEEGDRILRVIGRTVSEDMDIAGGVGGRISGDNFAALLPSASKDLSIARIVQQNRMAFSDKQPIVFSIGRYVITDPSLPASAIYDRAYIAKQSIKGRYDKHLAYFDDAMLEKLVSDQQIIADMDVAIAQHQFEIWFQPQRNHSTGALIGAEALVRWRHPKRGLIPPNDFIPVFEENGFIYELDKYVWEETCRHLRKWLDEDRKPLPVSVNISRYDVFRADFIETLVGLLQKYDIPVSLLRLEITESAFAKSTKEIVDIVKQLIDKGFTIEIDDFGSGYSSLNTLKSVPAQIVKLDMRFLEGDDDSGRGGSILESIVRMTKWLGMSVIAEGVEEKAQADYLASIGCSYIQGYLYARPMPAAEYEAYFESAEGEPHLLSMKTAPNLNNNSFWNPKSMDTLIFNSYVGAACIFEYHNHNIDLLRVNDKFTGILGNGSLSTEDTLKLDWISCLVPESLATVRDILVQSGKTGDEYTDDYAFFNITAAQPVTWLRATMRVIATAGERMLVYCTAENITVQKEAQERERAAKEQIEALLHDMPGGYAQMRVHADGRLILLHFNDNYSAMRDMTRDEITEAEGSDVRRALHKDDLPYVQASLQEALFDGGTISLRFRLRCKNDEYKWFAVFGRTTLENGADAVISAYYTDVNTQMQEEANQRAMLDNLPSGAGIYEFRDGQMTLVYQNKSYWELVGLGEAAFPDTSSMSAIHEDDIPILMQELSQALAQGRDVSCDIRLRHLTQGYRQVHLLGRIVASEGGFVIYATFTPISNEIAEARQQQARLALLTNNFPGGLAIYEGKPDALDKIKLIYFTDGFCRLFGFTREEYAKLAEQNPLSLVAASDMTNLTENINTLVHEGVPISFYYRAKVNGGESKWINVRAVMGEPNGDNLTVNAVFVDATEQRNALEELRISEEINRLAIEQSKAMVCQYDIANRRLLVSPNVNSHFGVASVEENIPEKPVREGKISSETAGAYITFYESILHGTRSGKAVFQRQSTDGWRWIDARFTTIFSDDNKPATAVISLADVTESVERNMAYQKWQQSLRDRAPESYSLYHCNISKDTVLDATEGLLVPIQHMAPTTSLSRRTAEYAERCIYAEDRRRFLSVMSSGNMLLHFSRGEQSDSFEYRENLPDGGQRWLRVSIDLTELPSSADVEAYVLFENIDAAKRAELDMLIRAETDSLTGLLNRKAFTEKMETLLRTQKPGTLSALFIIDLDGFKQVNDCFGHAVGDETLIQLSQKLTEVFREKDLICRLGGDEFMIYMHSVPSLGAVSEKAALTCALLHKSFSLDVQLSASIGISVAPDNGEDFESLYRKADAALYYVKGMGKDSYAVFTESMHVNATPSEPTEAEEPVLAVRPTAVPKHRMLIVDDNEINRDYLASLFEEDFIVDTAAEGTAALIRLRRYGAGISIVLLDLMMPGLDGFAVLRKMRENPVTQNIPVIVVSGMDERETCLSAIREGASDFITKPVDAEILQLRVASALGKSENEHLRAQNRYLALQNEEAKRLAEARRHSEELSTALHAAERADLAKSQFLSSMSHEIRTPLNAILGYNTIAKDEMTGARTDEERRQVSMRIMDYLTKSEVASRHLLTIINDVLDMSAIESGKMKVDHSPFDIRSLISSLTVMFFSQARAKGVDFEVLYDKPTEEWFVGDQLRINQVLTNLLSNAVKFTPDGGRVTLTIAESVVDESATRFRFVVSDTGIGMTQEYLSHIWTPFEQAEASISRRFGGTGLGLSITKNLVTLMDGKISVESKSGVGSTFTVDLTLQRTAQPQVPIHYDFSKINALIVDDDVNTCDYIKLLFDRCGAHCMAFTAGRQAIDAFATAKETGTPFNVCLVDWRMPQLDGFATISEIQRIASKDLPIVVVTAYDFSEVSEHAQELGISRFISKPLFQSSLFDLLATISGNQAAHATEHLPKYDFDGARVLLVEDNNMNMEVAKHILLAANIAVDCAWNGQEAIDIFMASKEGTYQAIFMDVHMPQLDGYEATRLIRASAHPDAERVPIIAMTADVFAEDIVEAHSAGMNDHIAKPIDISALFKLLSSYIGGYSK